VKAVPQRFGEAGRPPRPFPTGVKCWSLHGTPTRARILADRQDIGP